MEKLIKLTQESPSIQYLCKKDKRLAKVISIVGNIDYHLYDDPYFFLVHEIIEQMLSIKAGQKILDRLKVICDGSVTPDKINQLTVEEIQAIGTSFAKAQYIKELTDAVISGDLVFKELENLTDNDIIKQLAKLKGIGEWTAQMYLIFVLDRQDVLPTTDTAFLQVYSWLYKTEDCSKQSITKKCKKWKPYSSIAVRYFYRILDGGFTKDEFHLFK